MPSKAMFPPTVEIKRAIAAAERAGLRISSVEIHPRKIVIHSKDPLDPRTPEKVAYDEWKANDEELARRLRPAERQSDALAVKSKS